VKEAENKEGTIREEQQGIATEIALEGVVIRLQLHGEKWDMVFENWKQ
jgi:hypothetical protein